MASGYVTVGTTAAQIAPADPTRGQLLVQNLSASDVWIDFGRPAVAGQSLLLPPAPGPPILLDTEIFFADLQGSISAVAAADGSNVYYVIQKWS